MKKILLLLALAAMISLVMAANSPPTVPTFAGLATGIVGTSLTYTVASTDPNGNMVFYTIEWGDGTKSVSSGLKTSGVTQTFSHIYMTAGTFPARANARDSLKAYSSWATKTIAITTVNQPANRPPAVVSQPVGPTSGLSNVSYSYTVRTTDPDGDQLKYTFRWGDGTTSTTGMLPSGTTATMAHMWVVPTNTTLKFDVVAWATDEHGAS